MANVYLVNRSLDAVVAAARKDNDYFTMDDMAKPQFTHAFAKWTDIEVATVRRAVNAELAELYELFEPADIDRLLWTDTGWVGDILSYLVEYDDDYVAKVVVRCVRSM